MRDPYEHYPKNRPMSHPGSKTDELEDIHAMLKRVTTCPICQRPKTHHRLYGYRCNTPGHDEMARDLSHT